jgi:hypothetical protein
MKQGAEKQRSQEKSQAAAPGAHSGTKTKLGASEICRALRESKRKILGL